MYKNLKLLAPIVALVMFSAFTVVTPASAEKGRGNEADQHSRHQGNNKEKKGNKGKNHQNYRGGKQLFPEYFDDRQRTIAHDYFGQRFRRGHCPPGLAKKSNGCLSPGQAKKWRIGYPLPRDVIFYKLPPALLGQLGYPGPGHRYVRVAADILLIAVGTGMVIDAIEDLNSM